MDFTSSSLMLLVAQSGINHRSFTPQVKTSRPCYNFARGSCQFGDTCQFVHDHSMQAKSTSNSLWSSSSNLSGVSNNEVDPHGFEGIYKDGHGVKEFQRSFRHSDTERLSRSDEVLKLKNFKKDATLKLFKSTNQERYEHVGPEVTSSQDGNVYKMAKRDYTWLMISRCSRSHSSQDKETSSNLKSMITTSNHKLMIEVKRAQD
ncbi:zinc finger, CCHC-type containing protein [Tanacetum coccineum]